jgi:predicted alpha/beta superfamily hydrolase
MYGIERSRQLSPNEGVLPSGRGPAVFPGSTQFDLTSRISRRTYRIYISCPPGEAPPEGHPLFLAVDGNMVFPIAATVNATFGMAGKSALVVGVGYPSDAPMELMRLRTRDLTPPTPLGRLPVRPHLPPPKLEDYGGDEEFFRFLSEELMPLLARAYPLDSGERTLYGHSWGALFTVGVLLKHPDSFKHFVASSPSIWWNKCAVLDHLRSFRVKVQGGRASPRVLLMVGGAEESVPKPMPQMILDQVAERAAWLPGLFRGIVAEWFVGKMLREYRMVGNARRLAVRLRRVRGGEGYLVRFRVFAGEDHITSLPASVGRAFDFVLRG